MYIVNNISILLDEDSNFDEEITHLFNEASIFIFKFKKKHNQSGAKYTQNIYHNAG